MTAASSRKWYSPTGILESVISWRDSRTTITAAPRTMPWNSRVKSSAT
ncbi:hypothetical protein LUX73_17860 [Actinomadura madurae]|nr:hypothetical protein [Actinomadura madurae]